MAAPMIYTVVPYATNGEGLGKAIDRFANLLPNDDDWLLVMDHDIMVGLTPDWYTWLQGKIAKHSQYDAFTCKVNRIAGLNKTYQVAKGVDMDNHDMLYHQRFAEQRREKWENHGGKEVRDITFERPKASGYFLLIRKDVWKRVVGLYPAILQPGLVLHIDQRIHGALANAGYKYGMLEGLYVYHYYRAHKNPRDASHLKLASKNQLPPTHLNVQQSFDLLCKHIDMAEGKRPVAFIRYGDCELMMMTGIYANGEQLSNRSNVISTGNKLPYDQELSDKLKEAYQDHGQGWLVAPGIDYPEEPGMRKGVFAPWNGLHASLKNEVKARSAGRDMLSFPLFHYLLCFQPERFDEFMDHYVRGQRILFIGSAHLQDVERLMGPISTYVSTTEHQSWKQYEEIHDKLFNGNIDLSSYDVILPATGYLGKVLAMDIFRSGQFKGLILDLGSIFNVFKRDADRTWIKETQKQIIKRYGTVKKNTTIQAN